MYLIAGLGNPGRDYINTRHNIGFEAIDFLASFYDIKLNKIKHKAIVGEGIILNEKVMLAKPQTYMNLSGESLRELVSFYKIPIENLIVIYDDIALATGKIRIRQKGSDGGHNGMKSIIYQLATQDFPRIRIGVGAPSYDTADHVLGRFTKEEIPVMIQTVRELEGIIPLIIKSGIPAAMNKYNGNREL